MNVLVVEDNRGDVRLIRSGFDASAVAISHTLVTDGDAALEHLTRHGSDPETRPDLVLLDLNVPKVTGRDVLERIRREPDLRRLPTLVLSGSESDDHVRETRELGADGYFVKPVDPHEFISLVETVVEAVASTGIPPPGEHGVVE